MDSEILLNAGYTVLGGGLAAIFGFVSQWVYARKQRNDGIKKIQDLLKPEFKAIYNALMWETKINKSAKDIPNDGSLSSNEHEQVVLRHIENAGRPRIEARMWDVAMSSGHMINMNFNEIEIIQSIYQSIRKYDETMVKLDDKMHQDVENKFNGIIRGDFSILGVYFVNCDRAIGEMMRFFDRLDKIPWVDYDKIKATATSQEAT